jgi:molybdopterin-guanine dinucleotide biosynthesis protein A
MVSAAILLGGRAVRLGGIDKSALVVDGRSILDRQLTELSHVTDDILLVGGRLGDPRARAVADIVAGCGPLGGLHAALTEAKSETTIVIACDMPFISAPFVRYLAGLAAEAEAVVPQTHRGLHPLCAAYTRDCLRSVTRRLSNRQLRMLDLLADLRVRVVPPEELARFGVADRLVANVNTPADQSELGVLQAHEL